MNNYDRIPDFQQGVWLTLLVGVMLIGLLTGCADFKETNAMIAESNLQSRKAYADSMAACGADPACKVGVTASYFSNAGQQKFFKPETGVDYLNAGLPYAGIVERVWGTRRGGNGDTEGGITIIGDDNKISDAGNKNYVSGGSTQNRTFSDHRNQEFLNSLGYGVSTLDKSERTEMAPVPEPAQEVIQ